MRISFIFSILLLKLIAFNVLLKTYCFCLRAKEQTTSSPIPHLRETFFPHLNRPGYLHVLKKFLVDLGKVRANGNKER